MGVFEVVVQCTCWCWCGISVVFFILNVCKKSHRHEGTFTFTPNTMVGTTQGWLRHGTHIWKPGMVRAMRR